MNAIVNSTANRSSRARLKGRDLERPGWIAGIIREARQVAGGLQDCAAASLRQHTDRLREYVVSEQNVDDSRVLTLAAAGVIEAIRRVLGMELFDVQLHAGIIVSRGAVAEMQTGEGKTLSIVMPAYVQALSGRGVHVATPNRYLAGRDHRLVEPIFAVLGMRTGWLQDRASTKEIQAAYRADVTYGPGHAFGFDFLRDQLTLDRINSNPLGSQVYERLCGRADRHPLRQRGLVASIIDEVDHVLIDDAVSPLLLSASGEGESPDADVHRAARRLADRLEVDVHFEINSSRNIELNSRGFDSVYDSEEMSVHPELVRAWHEYVVLALRARHFYRRDVDYVLQDKRVQIVDGSTGRIYEDRTWSNGLHQAIEAREGLEISPESLPVARITRQRFYRSYQWIGGMTGTATSCERELAAVYGLPVSNVPLRRSSKRILLPTHLSLRRGEKLIAIAEEAERMIRAGRAVLIGTLSIAESNEVATQLTERGLGFELLNGVQDADEAAIVARAGRSAAVTVATSLAGRGTDIGLDPAVADQGGLHVIVAQKHVLERVDRQLMGRAARCGDPGSARVFVCAEDQLVTDHAPWVRRALARWDRSGRGNNPELDDSLRRAQAANQRQQASLRWRMLQSDRDDERLLDKSPPLERCCPL